MERKSSKSQHQFYTHWYAGDQDVDSWFNYLHRNLRHVESENVPFSDSAWSHDQTDADLHDKILKLLYESVELDASKISIIVMHGSVCLEGLISSLSEKLKAAQIVGALPEVWFVQNDLVVDTSEKLAFH
jgi:osmotically-inducible protein OsmY